MAEKVEAVLRMGEPRNVHELRSFIGAVTWYKSMWPRRLHVLAPLTNLCGDKPFKWDPNVHGKAFKTMKAMVALDAMQFYPDLNLPFDIYTNASDYQLGAAILQKGRPIAYWSKTLTAAQKNYNI